MNIVKHPKYLWFTAILVFLLQLGACSKAPVTSSQPGQKNESLQPKPFKGEVYESVNGQHRITLTSPDEAEVSEKGENIVCKYTKQDGKLRILVTALGTTKAEYFQITTDGLQDSEGRIYFASARLAAGQQYEQGVCYATGRGVTKDEQEAVKWFRKAAEQNYAQAQCSLGTCYGNGQGVARDAEEAAKWYRKAAEQNLAMAQNNLGACYEEGRGVAKDEGEAVRWYRKAAEQNYAMAQNNLGVYYHNGQGVAKDEAEALKWFRKAAEQNLALAQNNLGHLYGNGQGVAKDEAEAVKWYRKAVEQGSASAHNSLAWILATSVNPAIRNGADAVFYAEKAVAATNRRNPVYLDTLAAAYAETGQFEIAVSTAQEAIALLETEAEKDDYRSRLKLYEAKVPYRAKQ